MAVTYNSIIRQAALRLNAIAGTTPSALQSAYITTPLTVTQVVSADFPLASVQDACLLAEERLAHAIANVGNHPWRAYLAGVTASVAHKGALPSADASPAPVIGVWGSVYDASDGTVCTEKPLEVIRRRVENAGGFHLVSAYYYKIDGQRIYHTRGGVKLDCCVFDRAARQTAINTLTNNMLLPDVLEEAMVCGVVSLMVRDDAFMQQAQVYRGYFENTLAQIGQGLTSVPPKSIPGPTMAANAA